MEIEAIELGLARAARGGVAQVRRLAEAADTGAGARAEGDAALDGGAGEAGQDGGGLGEEVVRRAIILGLEVAAGEESPHAGMDGGEDRRHLCIARRGCGVK